MKSWPTKKLGELVVFLDNQRKPINDEERQKRIGPYPYYGANGQVGWIDGFIFDEDLVLLAEDGGYFGSKDRSIAYRISGKTWVNNHAHVLRVIKKIAETGFIHYKLMFYDIKPYITGSTRAKLNKSAAEKIKIQLPSLQIQKQIVERLDKVARAQKLNDDLIQKSNELFQSLLHKELDPAGKNWETKKLSEIGEISTGTTPSTKNREYWNGEFLWATPTDIKVNTFILTNTLKKLSREGYKKTRPVPQNSILVTCIASIGKMALAGKEMATNQQINSIVCNKKHNPFFVFFSLQNIKNKLIQLGKITAVPIINKSEFGRIKIFTPPLKTQKQIVEKLSAAQNYKTQLLAQKLKLKELFNSALAKSLNGEL